MPVSAAVVASTTVASVARFTVEYVDDGGARVQAPLSISSRRHRPRGRQGIYQRASMHFPVPPGPEV